jgi:hypothetical protein
MTEEVKVAPAEESKETKPAVSEAEEKQKETPEEETIGEVLGSKKEEPKNVPEAVFLELKKENKQLIKEMKELKRSIEDGASRKEINSDLKSLAERYNLSEGFLQDFAKAVKSQAESDLEEKVISRLKPLEEKEKEEKIDKAFNQHFEKVLEEMPEYKGIANKEVIKILSLNPANANKTFARIVEEAYGHLVGGKKTIETSTPRGGKNDNQEIDMSRIKDPAYFKEIMSNPELKKKYNDGLIARLKL